MLIEQIIEFELRGGGLPEPTYSYNWQNKNLFGISSSGLFYYLLVKYWGGNVPYFHQLRSNYVQNLTPKCEILNVFWT